MERERQRSEVKMPRISLSTNISLDAVNTSSILSQITSTVANTMAVPHSYVMVSLEGSIRISFGGAEDPAAYGELVSMVGFLNPDLNNKLTAQIALILETNLSVPKSRFLLSFRDIEGYNCGFNGSIFTKIESK